MNRQNMEKQGKQKERSDQNVDQKLLRIANLRIWRNRLSYKLQNNKVLDEKTRISKRNQDVTQDLRQRKITHAKLFKYLYSRNSLRDI